MFYLSINERDVFKVLILRAQEVFLDQLVLKDREVNLENLE